MSCKMVTWSSSDSMSKDKSARNELEADAAWRALGISAPARRALMNAGILNKDQLASWSVDDISALHGIGQRAISVLKPWCSR